MLLECGADLYGRSYDGNSPLHIACDNGKLEIAKQLLECVEHLGDWERIKIFEVVNKHKRTPIESIPRRERPIWQSVIKLYDSWKKELKQQLKEQTAKQPAPVSSLAPILPAQENKVIDQPTELSPEPSDSEVSAAANALLQLQLPTSIAEVKSEIASLLERVLAVAKTNPPMPSSPAVNPDNLQLPSMDSLHCIPDPSQEDIPEPQLEVGVLQALEELQPVEDDLIIEADDADFFSETDAFADMTWEICIARSARRQ